MCEYCSSPTWEVKAGRAGVQGHPQRHSEFENLRSLCTAQNRVSNGETNGPQQKSKASVVAREGQETGLDWGDLVLHLPLPSGYLNPGFYVFIFAVLETTLEQARQVPCHELYSQPLNPGLDYTL